ncbi:hypothetical protein GYH30_027619 [Glycine max]|nr:hypothetical protein GYH30_027619 [Glycine max]
MGYFDLNIPYPEPSLANKATEQDVDSTNACYGGTTTLFKCVNWVNSSSWDGDYGLIICTNIMVCLLQIYYLMHKEISILIFYPFF